MDSIVLVVTKNDTKLQTGTIATAKAGGSFLTMANGCFMSIGILNNLKYIKKGLCQPTTDQYTQLLEQE